MKAHQRPLKRGPTLTQHPAIEEQLRLTGLPDQAVLWLLDVWGVIQVFDDVADAEEVARHDLDSAIWASLVGMPSNPFFIQHASALLPVLGLQIQKWQASDYAERNGLADERSYMWRAGFYDLVLMCATLCGGCAAAKAYGVLALYGEAYAAYKSEFPDA